MLKARVTIDGKPGLLFGLSFANLDRLRLGQPIDISGAELGLPVDRIIIFAGETEQQMVRDLDHEIGPQTVVHIDPRLRQ